MFSKRFHKYIGLIMVLPMVGWATTGVVFLLKPGYEGAYETLNLKTYPLESGFSISADGSQEEIRIIKSILGTHVLAKSEGKYINLDPVSLKASPLPDKEQLKKLFEDTVSQNPARYGSIESIENSTALTSTGIEIELDWNEMKFTQIGFDREVISLLYKIHYLQWTPWRIVNQMLGVIGLLLLISLTVLGVRIYVTNRE